MKHELIMENWRKFLKEDKDENDQSDCQPRDVHECEQLVFAQMSQGHYQVIPEHCLFPRSVTALQAARVLWVTT